MYDPTNPDLTRLPAIFARYPEIRAVYLFGSVAEGRANPQSDLDLGIVPRSPKIRAQFLQILGDLLEAGYPNVDLILLDTDDITLKFEVVRRNHPIYLAPDFSHGDYFSKILRQYWDFLPYLERQRAAYKHRILNGQSTDN